jgi:hypothetical protein
MSMGSEIGANGATDYAAVGASKAQNGGGKDLRGIRQQGIFRLRYGRLK